MASVAETKVLRDVELVLKTVARAFYDDVAVCVVDGLVRDKFWKQDTRKDNFGKIYSKLKLPPKLVRKTLVFLQTEHWVASEEVSGIVETRDAKRTYRRSHTAKFWYLDYNRAFHSIRLRLHLLRDELQEKVIELSNASWYDCPTCKSRWTENEAQDCPSHEKTSAFLCRECYEQHKYNPDPPDIGTYTLALVDNSNKKSEAELALRRINVQMSEKTIGTDTLRRGIFNLLRDIRSSGIVVPSNLPSENGAERFLEKIENENTELEPDDGIVRTTTAQGFPVELQIESGASQRANVLSLQLPDSAARMEAVIGVTSREEQTSLVQKKRASAPFASIPQPKAACRQTTPYFLKQTSVRPSIAQNERDMQCLSINETTVSLRKNDEVSSEGDEPRKLQVSSEGDEPRSPQVLFDGSKSDGFPWDVYKEEKKRQMVLLPVASSAVAGDLFLSASSYASVQWEDV